MADERGKECAWETAYEISTNCDRTSFFSAIQVWIDKPHVVNRRLNGSMIVKRVFFSKHERNVLLEKAIKFKSSNSRVFSWENFLEELSQSEWTGEKTEKDVSDNELIEVILRRLLPRQLNRNSPLIELVILDKVNGEVYFLPLYLEMANPEETDAPPNKRPAFDFQMLQYRIFHHDDEDTAGSKRFSLQTFSRDIPLQEDSVQGDGVVCPSLKWLGEQLMPKLKKWAETPDDKKTKGSLRLISLEKYTLLYQKMKEKHGERLVKTWPESTDPQKFVYEDIAIATYLLIMWEEERVQKNLKEKQSFVDVGCGNGLLVHLLAAEGHKGVGIDVRKRKIWDYFGSNTKLEERAVDPTAAGLFADVDWLLGNHSDELTPWLPVMAARSSSSTRYFVLPCCLYDFNCKFIRTNSKVSQYRDYLNFVHDVGVTCGFEVEEDVLRIPSTKRTCQIGRCKTCPGEDQLSIETRIKEMIKNRGCDIDKGQRPSTLCQGSLEHTHSTDRTDHSEMEKCSPDHLHDNCMTIEKHSESRMISSSSSSSSSSSLKEMNSLDSNATIKQDFVANSSDFTPRSSSIVVRNCSLLSKSLKEFMVNRVANALVQKTTDELDEHSLADEEKSSSSGLTSTGKPLENWNCGGSLPLPDVAQLFDKEILQQLKQECGGIQTLLRNHRHIFKVVGGAVQLRDWRQEVPGPKMTGRDPAYLKRRYDALYKTTMCWFHGNHPDGCCCLQCPYVHNPDELKERPTAEYLKCL